jgi:hypothetical protein
MSASSLKERITQLADTVERVYPQPYATRISSIPLDLRARLINRHELTLRELWRRGRYSFRGIAVYVRENDDRFGPFEPPEPGEYLVIYDVERPLAGGRST